MKIKIKRSKKRKKTASAKLKNDVMEVIVPYDICEKRLNEIIELFKRRFKRRTKERLLNKENKLQKRAQELNKKYFNGKLEWKSIKYSLRQLKKFGTCNLSNKTIIINGCLKNMPQWVEDYVIIHELAHLIHPNHSKEFWQVVKKYQQTERAIGYLMAKGIEEI